MSYWRTFLPKQHKECGSALAYTLIQVAACQIPQTTECNTQRIQGTYGEHTGNVWATSDAKWFQNEKMERERRAYPHTQSI